MNINRYFFISLVVGLIIILIFPWSTTISIPAELIFRNQSSVHAIENGQIQEIDVNFNMLIRNRTKILELYSPDLIYKKKKLQAERQHILEKIQQDKKQQSFHYLQKDDVHLREVESELDNINRTISRLSEYSNIEGVVTNRSDDLIEKGWVGKGDYLFRLIDTSKFEVRAYLPEYELERVHYIKSPIFLSNNISQGPVKVSFVSKSINRVQQLSRPYLSSQFSGEIDTHRGNDVQAPVVISSYYPMIFKPVDLSSILPFEQRGVVIMTVKKQSILMRVWQKAAQIIIRESSF